MQVTKTTHAQIKKTGGAKQKELDSTKKYDGTPDTQQQWADFWAKLPWIYRFMKIPQGYLPKSHADSRRI